MTDREAQDSLLDAEGYPTEATLTRIREWKVESNSDFAAVMDFAGRAWSYPDYWTVEPAFDAHEYPGQKPQRRYVFSTGGWSGNESIVDALEHNLIVQLVGAWSWRRGGHYEYRFPLTEGDSR